MLGIRRDHPRRWMEIKFCMVAGLQEIVLRFELYKNRLSRFGAVWTRSLPFPIHLVVFPFHLGKSMG